MSEEMKTNPNSDELSGEEGKREFIGVKAPDFSLKDHLGTVHRLHSALIHGPALLVFYPGDFTMICTKQLCNYRDSFSEFCALGIQIFGISHNSIQQHADFASQYNFPFPLLSDPGNAVAKAYGCRTLFMLGGMSRAIIIINRQRLILYRYVEPTKLTRRSADELLGILRDLNENNLL